MRQKRHWLLGVLLLLLGVFTLIPVGRVWASSGENWQMNDSTGVLTVTGNDFYIDSTSLRNFKEDVKQVIVKKGVTELSGSAFSGCSQLTSVTLPSTLTALPNSCFSGCESLPGVNLPKGLTSIGMYAFYDCKSLKSIGIPENVTSIGSSAFAGCEMLSGTVKIPEGITQIESSTFENCKSLTGVTLPSTLTGIFSYAFHHCESLTSLKLPENVTLLGNSFQHCVSLREVKLNQGLNSLDNYCFYGCTALQEIVIPSSVESIRYQAFGECTSLSDIVVLNSEAYIDGSKDTLGPTALIHCLIHSNAHSYAEQTGHSVHFLDAGVVKRKATASSYGEKSYHCSTCGRNYTEELPPLLLKKPDVTNVEVTSSGLKVTWTASEGAEGYRLYRKTSGSDYVMLKKIYRDSTTSYTDTKAKSGTTYTYALDAYTGIQQTEKGTEMSATYLKKPVISSLSSTTKGVKIQWKKVEGAGQYAIYRGKTYVTQTSGTSYVDTGAKKNGTSYKYKVVAYLGSYGSVTAESSTQKTYYLLTQKITSAKNAKGKKLTIKYGKNNRASGYEIQYSTSSSFKKSATKTVTVKKYKTTTKTISKLKKGKTYYVRVRSYLSKSGKKYYGAWSGKKKVKINK